MSIYGPYEETLNEILLDVEDRIKQLNRRELDKHQPKLYEHLIGRVKTPSSMEEKCQRKNYPLTTESALRRCRDAVGIRIVCNFISDIDRCLDVLRNAEWCSVVKEKDYITKSKPNGYRSYHLILDVVENYRDIGGNNPGHFFVEIQLRTIAMDSWASLEHEIKYKHHVKNPERIGRELKRCADQLASCDIQMETIRQLIRED
ncbi:MAG: GTP pyrophosphokinase family protein [Limosilactobacillus sp.]|jgi:ppGpp synthetase/RelA/SpoT-type nucleotidyltranferase|uniref:GTP pyrophosphokinase n=1 Tax=Limosilactobacillus sp. TaxID=2773925 RepID=UPI0025C37D25|nr:GTP pyrophosphokinase family protein [Limosilactobacillus sp.]MCI1974755.1 GTP pyrophosphokinase family protein [Limosilactobacillus sp.]MCI2030952.1 GTP pyrophosphokinase family protein [Limosilactobacillus sp.]